MDPVAARLMGLVLAGAIFGLLVDRVAARWPRHADGRVRGVDWRTATLAVASAASFTGLASRWSEPRDLIVLGVFFAALLAVLATDLDQRLLPDALTLPLIPYAIAVLLLTWNPLLNSKSLGLVSGLMAGIGAPAALALTSRLFRGGVGMGDLKLAVSLGLMCGVSLLTAGFLVASIIFAVLLIPFMLAGQIGRRSAIPLGPLLITAGVVGALFPVG